MPNESKKYKKKMVRKNITIREDHEDFVYNANLNLSRFVQDRLDQYMVNHPDRPSKEE